MENIPDELLVHIFSSFRTYQEFIVLSCVCKKWNEIIWHLQQQLHLIKFKKILQEDLLERLLVKIPAIKTIEMPTQTEDRHIDILSNFVSLEKLSLRRCIQLTDEGINPIEKLTNLKELHLSCSWNLKKLDFLTSLVNSIEQIELRGCDMLTSDTFTCLQQTTPEKFIKLTKLDLRDCIKVDDTGIEAIVNIMPNLTLLDVAGTKVTVIGAQAIATLHNLEVLILWGCSGIDDSSLSILSSSRSLKHLNLIDCVSITDVGLRHLSENKSLVSVELGGKLFSDLGLASLARIPTLERLLVISENPALTEAKVQEIIKKYPALSIKLTKLDSDEE